MLNIIYAPHGGGKTNYILGAAGSAVSLVSRAGGLKPLYIVPEQAHFETERRLYYELGRRHIKDIEITSFTKLSGNIMSKYGSCKPYCDDIIKIVSMMNAVNEVKNSFIFYDKSIKVKNFSRQMLALIEIFKREGIEPADLPHLKESSLQKKLSDISLVYTKYDEFINSGYSDKFDDVLRASKISRNIGFFLGRRVFFDGFDSFSGSQRKLIAAIIASAEEVSITLNTDGIPAKNRDYFVTDSVIARLEAICKNEGSACNYISVPRAEERGPKMPAEFMTAPDIYTECDYVAAKIHSLIHEGGYNCNDIAIFVQNRETLPVLETSMRKYDIPDFADVPSSILEKPFIKFILLALEAADFNGDSVINYIKSGFVRVSSGLENAAVLARRGKLVLKGYNKNESFSFLERGKRTTRLGRRNINELDKICSLYKIQGNDWKKRFPEIGGGRAAEPLRREITGKLSDFAKKLKNTTGDKITEALSDFLINELELGRTVLAIVNRRNAEFKKGFQIDRSLSDEYRKLWDLMITTLESMYSALSGYPIDLGDYLEMLKEAFSRTDIAKPPQTLDAVSILDVERSRSENIKIAFITGANSGVFPAAAKQTLFFTSDELDELVGLGVELSDDRKGRYYRQRFIAHKAMSTPSEKLFITAPLNDLSWEPLETSVIFSPEKTCSAEDLPVSFFVRNLNSLKQSAARNPRDEGLKSALLKYDPVFLEKFSRKYTGRHEISVKTAMILMNREYESPTSLKYLASCPFSYFCRYGLSIFPDGEENTDEPSALLKGELTHNCIERITEDFSTFMALSNEEILIKTSDLTAEFIKNLTHKEYIKKRVKYLFNLQKEDIVKTLISLREEFADSPFKIISGEKPFSYSTHGINIKGRIDRIDALETDGKKLLRVVDYKSGKNRFDWDNVYYGLDLQILLYLFAAGEGAPSGAYTKNTGTGESKTAEYSEDLVPNEKEVLKNWHDSRRMNGIQLDNGADTKEIERLTNRLKSLTGSGRTKFITARQLMPKEFERLKSYIGNMLLEKKSSVIAGRVPAIPAQKDKNREVSPCGYCDYRDMCDNGDEYVKIEKGMTDRVIAD
ncbi:MAG: PD-(D/E)XK nuclease family protein [Eubacterium sp.]|jgi:ATP-dependent helicase/nuclease subunit B|nr:PD-(D/E)XK nuclease family protein [Eubacterium sp.]